jgi:hypothetical protein
MFCGRNNELVLMNGLSTADVMRRIRFDRCLSYEELKTALEDTAGKMGSDVYLENRDKQVPHPFNGTPDAAPYLNGLIRRNDMRLDIRANVAYEQQRRNGDMPRFDSLHVSAPSNIKLSRELINYATQFYVELFNQFH